MRALSIEIVTPAQAGSRSGNRVTALRWARALRRLGQRVRISSRYSGEPRELLIALHALKSLDSVLAFRKRCPDSPIVVALAGTDLLELDRARQALALADRIVVLQERALRELTPEERRRARVIVQSASAAPSRERPAEGFVACVLAHLRSVKDPLLPAAAARRVAPASRLIVVHAGAALDPGLAAAAERESQSNPRYRWLGDLPRSRALALLAGADVLVVSSSAEGGANVISEAIACGLPVLSSRIDGSIGLLGPDHPGYFTPGDPDALARLLVRVETDVEFRGELRRRSHALRAMVDPLRETEVWRELLGELTRKGGAMNELRLTQLVQGGG